MENFSFYISFVLPCRSSFEKHFQLKFYCNEKLVSLILMDSLLSYFSLKSEAARVLCCLLENRSSDELFMCFRRLEAKLFLGWLESFFFPREYKLFMLNINSFFSRLVRPAELHARPDQTKESCLNHKRSRSSDDLFDSINQLRKGKYLFGMNTSFTASLLLPEETMRMCECDVPSNIDLLHRSHIYFYFQLTFDTKKNFNTTHQNFNYNMTCYVNKPKREREKN